MVVPGRHSPLFRKSLRRVSGGIAVAWRGDADRRCDVSSWLAPARLPGVEHEIRLRRTGCRPFPTDGSPTPLGVDERSLQALPVLHELETIFLDSPVDFPSEIHVIAKHDGFHQTRKTRMVTSRR